MWQHFRRCTTYFRVSSLFAFLLAKKSEINFQKLFFSNCFPPKFFFKYILFLTFWEGFCISFFFLKTQKILFWIHLRYLLFSPCLIDLVRFFVMNGAWFPFEFFFFKAACLSKLFIIVGVTMLWFISP